jgi:hypothetical protein
MVRRINREMRLEPRTLELLDAVFGTRVCKVCRAPAERLSGEHFYCGFHFPQRQIRGAESIRQYHCTIDGSE